MPTAADITLNETLDLLDGDFAEVAKAICEGGYAFWLGSGISRDRVIGLDGVLLKLIEFLRVRVTAVPGCAYRAAFDRIIGLAKPSAAERAQIDLGAPPDTWTCIRDLLPRLWGQYSEVFETRIVGEAADHLLWDGLEFAKTFGSEKPDAEHLAVAILTLEGAVTHVATPNWDGLLEAALEELGHGDEVFRITVTGDDLREAKAAPATLYKFHGCARLAIADEARYRQLLVVRAGQIARWNDAAAGPADGGDPEDAFPRDRPLRPGS